MAIRHLLTISLVLISLNQSAVAQEVLARVAKLRETVRLKHMNETSFSAVSVGQSIVSGDVINVDEAGFCMVIFLDDKSVLKIRESTQFEFVETVNTRTLNIEFGKILSDIKRERKKDFQVSTAVSVASVKATQWWSVVNEMGFDRFYGLEGEVEVFNTVSGQSVTLGPGQMVLSTATGQLVSTPVDPEEMPDDPEAEMEEGIEEEEMEEEIEPKEELEPEPEDVEAPEPEIEPEEEVFFEEEAPEAAEEAEEAAEPEPERPKPFNMGLGIGSATIDGVIYNQFALRPEFRIGKLGIGLDLVLYIDNAGNVRQDEWDEASDVVDKFLYLRWAEKTDPFWFKVGALEGMTLGYGGILSGYSNMMEFPSVRRVGVNFGVNVSRFGGEIFLANVKDFARGGTLLGLRGSYTVSEKFPLTLGANLVTDINQFSGFKDTDDDFIPDIFDAFPAKEITLPETFPDTAFGYNPGDILDGNKYSKDSDNDGIPDELDYDRDGDGLTDYYPPDTTRQFPLTKELDPDPFSLKKNKSTAIGFALDIGYPVLRAEWANVVLYGEYNVLSFPEVETEQFRRPEKQGTGITIPGIRSMLFKFLNLSFEYRIKQEYFVPQFFDQAYDLNRVVPIYGENGAEIFTKDMLVFADTNSVLDTKGYFGSAGFNLFNLAKLSASYTNMAAEVDDTTTLEFNSFFTVLSLNTDNIPKLSEATAYYQRNNDPDPFDFENPSINTLFGYRLGYEISKGVSLVWDFRQFYRDTGAGLEPVKQTTIETKFTF